MRTRSKKETPGAGGPPSPSLPAVHSWSIQLNDEKKIINEVQLKLMLSLYLLAYAQRDARNPRTAVYQTAENFFIEEFQLSAQLTAQDPSLNQSELTRFANEKMEKLLPHLEQVRTKRKAPKSGVITNFKEFFQEVQKAQPPRDTDPRVITLRRKITEIKQKWDQIKRNLDKQDTTTNERSLALDDLNEIFYSNIEQFYNNDKIRVHKLSNGQEVVPLDVWNMAEGKALLEYNASVKSAWKLRGDLTQCENELQSAEVELTRRSELLSDSMLPSPPPAHKRKRKEETLSAPSLADPLKETEKEAGSPYDVHGSENRRDDAPRPPLWARPQEKTYRDESALRSTRDPLSDLEKNTTPPMQSLSNASFFGGGTPLPLPDGYRPPGNRSLFTPDYALLHDDFPGENKRFKSF